MVMCVPGSSLKSAGPFAGVRFVNQANNKALSKFVRQLADRRGQNGRLAQEKSSPPPFNSARFRATRSIQFRRSFLFGWRTSPSPRRGPRHRNGPACPLRAQLVRPISYDISTDLDAVAETSMVSQGCSPPSDSEKRPRNFSRVYHPRRLSAKPSSATTMSPDSRVAYSRP